MSAAATTRTPWGDAEGLRGRRLWPRSGASAEEVARNQCERLMAATVAVGAKRGYEAMTVADLLALSGVSRADFYRHFADKQACFMAALEEILERAMRYVALRYDGRGSALRSFIELIVDQPAAGRLCFVEAYAAGPEALAAMDAALAAVEGLYERAFAARGGQAEMPRELVGAIVGGLCRVIYTRLRSGREEELAELASELWDWSFSYQAPCAPLRRRGGGTGGGQYRSKDPAARIIAAAGEVVAERGYGATTLAAIVAEAGISFSTFYEHFDDKEDAVAAALDAGQAQLFGLTTPAFRRAREWPAAVRASLEAMFDYLAAEPAFARLAMVESYGAGRRSLDRRDQAIARLERYLEPGFEYAPQTPRLASEAIGGAVYALLYEQIRRAGPESLPALAPSATYLALAPFLGAEEACEVANGRAAPASNRS